jgi:septal ring-binding cell division protein DamX
MTPPAQERPGMDCPTCGAPARRGQLVCLECGSRIALTYRRPPSWKLPAAIVALVSLLALAGAAGAYRAIDDDADREVSSAKLEPKEGRRDTTPAAKPKAADPKPAKPKAAQPAPAEPTPGGLVKKGALYTWPTTLDAFTVVVLSAEDRASATRFAQSVAEAGDAKAGVIRSDDFETLPKGFFVVFAGSYPTRPRAEQAATRLGRKYPSAFPQRVSR